MKNLYTWIFCLPLITHFLWAQSTGHVSYPYLGIEFTIPQGWVGQELEGGYLIGHQSQPGIGFLTVLQANSLEEIRVQGQQGITEANGTRLIIEGDWETITPNALGSEFKGTLEGTPVKAYLVGVYNEYGNSVMVMAAAAPNVYADIHKNLALQLTYSLSFSEAKESSEALEWKDFFSNAKLTYMESYYSNGGSYNGFSTGGGYEMTEEIHLCAQGYFKFKGSSSMTMDTGGAFGSSFDRSNGDGQWEIETDYQGGPVLTLTYHNGNVQEYKLTYEDNKTFLNGARYYVTYAKSGPDYAPDCF